LELWTNLSFLIRLITSTDLYRSCAALENFSGTFDLILFEAVNLEFIVCLLCGLVEFGLVYPIEFGLVSLFHRQTNKLNNYLFLINLICEFVY